MIGLKQQNTDTPKVTVLMPVYNGEKYVGEAIESILGQTFKYFEFLIINDGSTDKSEEIIRSYKDPRIRLINNERNLGLADSLNIGLKEASGEYIARMDQDDISLPSRLAKQVTFLDQHPDIGVVGSQATIIDEHGQKQSLLSLPLTHPLIAWTMFFKNPMAHPSVMMRRSVLSKQFYQPESCPEDYELWSRLIFRTKFVNFAEPLIRYRFHTQSMVNLFQKKIQVNIPTYINKYLSRYYPLSESDFIIFKQGLGGRFSSWTDFRRSNKILKGLLRGFLKQEKLTAIECQTIMNDYRQKRNAMCRWYVKKLVKRT